MKKILYLSDVAIDSTGGAQESMKLIINELKDEFEFHMITPNSKKEIENQIIYTEYEDFILKKMSKIQLINLLNKIKKDIQNIKPDIIHVQMQATMLVIGILKTINLINRDIKIIYTDRGVLTKYGKATKIGLKIFTKRFDKLVTTTYNNGFNYTKLNYIKDKEKHNVIPNAAGYMFDSYDGKKHSIIRHKYNIKQDDIVIGFSGRQAAAKNWPLAINIIKALNEKYSFKVCIAIGTDKTDENIKEAKETIDNIRKIIGEDRLISFMDVSLKKMNELYYINDIFVLSSKDESFGRTAIEAMSRKNIVFGTKVDGLQEVVHFEDNKYQTVEEFLKKIECIFKSPEKIEEEKNKFYIHYKEKYSTSICILGYRNLYKESLE